MEKRLCRVRDGKMLAGVCGGIARYFGVDPTIVRLIWAVATLFGVGSGVPLYIVAAIIMPKEPDPW